VRSASFTHVLRQARAEGPAGLGALLDVYRSYLKLLARAELSQRYGMGDPSDLAQEVFLRAYKAFGQFRGTTEAELTAWLRQIMARCLVEFYRRNRRLHRGDLLQQQVIGAYLDRSSGNWTEGLLAPDDSPSQSAVRRESAVLLAAALDRLPVDYREAIVLRQVEGLPWSEVARRMDRSFDSVRKLWCRGIIILREVLHELT